MTSAWHEIKEMPAFNHFLARFYMKKLSETENEQFERLENSSRLVDSINPFFSNASFLYPLKTLENLKVWNLGKPISG